MLSINETMNSILKQLTFRKKGHRDIFEVSRTHNELVIGASCIELDGASLGRILITQIKHFRLHNKPISVSFTIDCNVSEVRIVCSWALNGFHRSSPKTLNELSSHELSNA